MEAKTQSAAWCLKVRFRRFMKISLSNFFALEQDQSFPWYDDASKTIWQRKEGVGFCQGNKW